jgi:single-strand DNA-binding protein
MLNHITLMGRLTHTPELKHTASGTAYVNCSLAVERDFKDKQSGEKVTDFLDILAWSHTAEFICNYFAKGRMMVVSGRIQTDSYTDKNGNKRKSVKVVADSVYFGDSKRNGDSTAESRPSENAYAADYNAINEDDDELPFIV